MHNPQMPKLDSRASKMMLVGQSEKGYLLFDPINSKIFLSRNVKILEDINYFKQPTEKNHPNANVTIKTSQEEIPRDYTEALVSPHKDKWQCAMLEEYQSLIDNDVFEEVQKNSQRIIDTKWVFTVKTNEHGIPTRYKARLVAKGFKQVHRIDYLKSYAPFSNKSTVRIFLTAVYFQYFSNRKLEFF